MELKEQIKKGRVRQKIKEQLPETVLAAVAGIVKKFNLQALPGERGYEGELPAVTKPADRLSLFPLLTAGQWRLTRELVARFDNPYLMFARSPEEISLSRRLYESNPHLTEEALREQSLGTLWAQEGMGKSI
jgi:hypothetical protein